MVMLSLGGKCSLVVLGVLMGREVSTLGLCKQEWLLLDSSKLVLNLFSSFTLTDLGGCLGGATDAVEDESSSGWLCRDDEANAFWICIRAE